MECIALGYYKKNGEIKWHVENNPFIFFSIDNAIRQRQQMLIQECTNMDDGDFYCYKLDKYYLMALRIQGDCCMVVCDARLSSEQIFNLSLWVLFSKLTLNQIANEFDFSVSREAKLHDPVVDAIEAELTHLREDVLPVTLDKLCQREEELKDLNVKAEHLKEVSFRFREDAEELNSCWPICQIM